MDSPRSPRPRYRDPRLLAVLLLLLALPWLVSCSTLSYYGQAAWGHTKILLKRRDLGALIADPRTPEALREQLVTVARVREFADNELALPAGRSYRAYVQLPSGDDGTARRAVVWNVVAAPELDVAPLVWCFPVAGCVSYRGYFKEARARRFAGRLERQGYDVDVAGAAAYSTLGWFADPVLSTVIDYPEADLAGLLFHELAHRLIYVRDDSTFNESFASTVETEGVRRYLAAGGHESDALEAYLARQQREDQLVRLVSSFRDRLRSAYASDAAPDAKLERKREILAELEATCRDLRASWSSDATATLDCWPERAPNNATLASYATYHDLVPAFESLLERHGGDLEAFYQEVRRLAELAGDARQRELARLADEPSP